MHDLVLSLHNAPGDTLVLTALLRDLHRAYPGRFRAWADVNYPELLRHSPDVHAAGRWPGRAWPASFRVVKAEYAAGIAHSRHEAVHFLSWFHRDFAQKTGLAVPLTHPAPAVTLSAAECAIRIVPGRYWVVVAGGKPDAMVKLWPPDHWRRLVALATAAGIPLVQCGAAGRGHLRVPLEGVTSLVGRTTLREALRVIAGADGVVCGLTFAMHAAAALGRPCVVLAGGREAPHWEAYARENPGLGGPAVAAQLPMPHRFLHATGLLTCAAPGGCWRNDVVPDGPAGRPCHQPVDVAGRPAPRCQALVAPGRVLEAMLAYYADGSLPPLPPLGAATRFRTADGRTGTITVRMDDPADDAPPPPHLPRADSALDDPALGGRMTAFMLLYGDFPQMHRANLTALLETTPRDRVEVRLGSNQLGDASRRFVAGLVAAGLVAAHYEHAENALKYPVMREMFHDPARPVATPYLLWLDDDTRVVDPGWLGRLAALIAREHPNGARMFGPAYQITLAPGQAEWIRAAAWYRGRPFRDRRGHPSPTGTQVHFCAGSFWALHTPTMRECDVPDPRLNHCGGDVAIGEQLYQMGHTARSFPAGKSVVAWSDAPRRGHREPPAGSVRG